MAGTGIKQFESYCIARTGPSCDPLERAMSEITLMTIKNFKMASPKNRAARSSTLHTRVTPTTKKMIVRLHRETQLSQLDIADRFGLNMARVNEVLQQAGV